MRTHLRHDLVQIGFALAAYRSELGAYPETLDELVPSYLLEIPLDKCSEKPFIYLRRENGFLAYSVGANGRDDGGRMQGASNEDDISIEVPLPIEK